MLLALLATSVLLYPGKMQGICIVLKGGRSLARAQVCSRSPAFTAFGLRVNKFVGKCECHSKLEASNKVLLPHFSLTLFC